MRSEIFSNKKHGVYVRLGVRVERHESVNEFLQSSFGLILAQTPLRGCVEAEVSLWVVSVIRSRADQVSIVHRGWERYRAGRPCIDVAEVERQLLQAVTKEPGQSLGTGHSVEALTRPE